MCFEDNGTNGPLWIHIYSFAVAFISLCIYLPLAIYGVYRFRRQMYNIIIRKRHPQVTLVIAYLSIAVIIAEGIRALFTTFFPQGIWWTYPLITAFLTSLTVWVTLRLFLNFYAINYSQAMRYNRSEPAHSRRIGYTF